MLSEWWANPAHDPETLQSAITPLLKGEQHLVDEFSLFFPKAKPPNRYRRKKQCFVFFKKILAQA